MKFYLKFLIAILISLFFGYLAPEPSIELLESSLVSMTGAVVGGVIAALAFIFGLLLEIMRSSKTTNNLFEPLSTSLKSDVMLLIWTLCFSIFLPLIRKINFPYLQFPDLAKHSMSKDQIITSCEIFLVIVAISVLFEICSSMFKILVNSVSK